MDYKLKNGFTMEIKNEGKEVSNTYLSIEATRYHGDADYDVNNNTEIYFNDGEFTNLVSFICYNSGCDFDEIKEEYQKLFEDEDDFNSMKDEWYDFCTSYSEMHDQTKELDVEYFYIIEGKKYEFNDVKLDIFN